MDLDDALEFSEAVNIDGAGLDIKELVESIYNDNGIFPGSLPDSPPDSGSEHLLSPRSGVGGSMSPPTSEQMQLLPSSNDNHPSSTCPDLNSIDYSVPLQLIEQSTLVKLSSTSPPAGSGMTQLPKDAPQGATFQNTLAIKDEVTDDAVRQKRRRKDIAPSPQMTIQPDEIKMEASSSPGPNFMLGVTNSGSVSSGTNIRFDEYARHSWHKAFTRNLVELEPFRMMAIADKGFNFSTVDEAFVAQKKNHFQVTCHIDMPAGEDCHYVKAEDGVVKEIAFLQLNFYGAKLDIPNSYIRVEQSQSDRSKVKFNPIPIDFRGGKTFKTSVGRLHFTETTANNMRKKGKPNPGQKYFQLVVALEAVPVSPESIDGKQLTLVSLASEKIIVRASNPGQFEPDTEVTWQRDPIGETIFHMGKVGINTEQGNEALTVHGNLQLTGQVFQPSDLRIKERIREVSPRKQLENVNQIRIVEFKYKEEFVDQLPEEQRTEYTRTNHTGVIAQDIQKILPEAVSQSGNYMLSNGVEVGDMLIVNKDRIFLENVGAVRELSKMTGTLENRIDDLERANETVTVKLTRLKRKFSIDSNSTSSSQFSKDEKVAKRFRRRKMEANSGDKRSSSRALFQSRWIQLSILALVSIMALSLTAMAVMYIMDYYKSDSKWVGDNNLFLNGSSSVESNEIPQDGHMDPRARPITPEQQPWVTPGSSNKDFLSSQWKDTTRSQPEVTLAFRPPIIGVKRGCRDSLASAPSPNPACLQSECCPLPSGEDGETNRLTRPEPNLESEIANAILESIHPNVLLVEPSAEQSDEKSDVFTTKFEHEDAPERDPGVALTDYVMDNNRPQEVEKDSEFSNDIVPEMTDDKEASVVLDKGQEEDGDVGEAPDEQGRETFNKESRLQKLQVEDLDANKVSVSTTEKDEEMHTATQTEESPGFTSTSNRADSGVTKSHTLSSFTDNPDDGSGGQTSTESVSTTMAKVEIANTEEKDSLHDLYGHEDLTADLVAQETNEDDSDLKTEEQTVKDPPDKLTDDEHDDHLVTKVDVNDTEYRDQAWTSLDDGSDEVSADGKADEESDHKILINNELADKAENSILERSRQIRVLSTTKQLAQFVQPDEKDNQLVEEPGKTSLHEAVALDDGEPDVTVETGESDTVNGTMGAQGATVDNNEGDNDVAHLLPEEVAKAKKDTGNEIFGSIDKEERRAKREVHFLAASEKTRRIRNVDESDGSRSDRAIEGQFASNDRNNGNHADHAIRLMRPPQLISSSLSPLGDHLNVTLDHRFCDPHTSERQFRKCRRYFGLVQNVSLAIPLSKYFTDDKVILVLPGHHNHSHALCLRPQEGVEEKTCHSTPSASSGLAAQQLTVTTFKVEVGSRVVSTYTIRSLVRGDVPDVTPDNLCDIAQNKLGTIFLEYNFRFYRVCHA